MDDRKTYSRSITLVFIVVMMGCSTPKAPKATKAPEQVENRPAIESTKQKTNQACVNIIREFEGVRLDAYIGPAGHWLIGYGHKAGVTEGMVISDEQAETYLREDLQYTEKNISRLVKQAVSNNQYSALVCLAYNIGVGNFSQSTLLRRVNAKKYQQAADEFLKWRMVNKKVNAHQEKRRAAERQLFLAN